MNSNKQEASKPQKRKEPKIHELYQIIDGKLTRKNPFCLRCGTGTFMGDHGDFWVCGKCGLRRRKNTS